VGICGTDREIVGLGYGCPPEGEERLVFGHEAVGRSRPGDLVVGIVGVPDPVPKDARLIKVDAAPAERAVLLEPASVIAKAWEQVVRIGERACFSPRVAVIIGAGGQRT